MNLYFLDQAQTEALQAKGYRLDNTDNLDNLPAILDDVLAHDELMIVMERSRLIMALPKFKEMGTTAVQGVSDYYGLFNTHFPELASKGPYALWAHIEKCEFLANRDGDIIVCNTEGVVEGDFAEKAVKALSTQMSLNDVFKTPLWSYIAGGR